jgi:hypothetical protein
MSRFVRLMFWIGMGVALGYLFDPNRGKGRRAKLADQTRARMRHAARDVSARARYEAGKARGLVHEVFSEETPPLTDADLLQKVRSEAVGPTGNLGEIEVRVDEGTVELVGPSIDPAREEELMERIEKVVGVTGIRNELRRATRVEESENR